MDCSMNSFGTVACLYRKKKMKWDHYLILQAKNNSGWIKDLDVQGEILQLFTRKYKRIFLLPWYEEVFLRQNIGSTNHERKVWYI